MGRYAAKEEIDEVIKRLTGVISLSEKAKEEITT